MYQAFKRGMQSVADNIAAKQFSRQIADQQTANIMQQLDGLSARELGERFPQIQQQSNQFAQEFLSSVKPFTENNLPDKMANHLGKRLTQTSNFVMQNPAGQMALFSAPMLAPMLMGSQQEISPEEIAYMQQQQMQRGYQ